MENFVVSARKYRPATFQSVVGQKHITSTLKNAIERGQLAHAYLFCGPRGVGKTTCARIFAKAINCLEPQGAEACNACESCRSFNENRSLNIHELDAASNNSVDDIRSLIEQVRIIPQVGHYSVFIIDEVHMLSQAAFNAFLKTLEEPPAHAIFILATTEKHKIIPTILSRCQIYDFNRIRVEDAVEYLRYIASQEEVTADDESLNLIAQKADGGMRDALSMFDKAVSFCGRELHYHEVAQTLNVLDYDTYFQVTEQLMEGDYRRVLLTFDAVLTKGFSGQTFLSGLNKHLRDLLVARDPATLSLIEMTGTLLERYRVQAQACDVGFLFGAIDILTEMDGKIRQSSNQRLLVELGLMKIAGLGQKKNNDIPSVTGSYALPPLEGEISSGSAGRESAQGSQRPQGAPAAAEGANTPTIQAVAETPGTPEPPTSASAKNGISATPINEAPTNAPAASVPNPAPKNTPQSSEEARPRMARTPLISLSELMNGRVGEELVDQPVEAQANGETPEQMQAKIEGARAVLLEAVREMRPRFFAAFEKMRCEGKQIWVEVPTHELEEEILRSRTELLLRMVEVADLKSAPELCIRVNEQIKAALPIRLEDRLTFLLEKNPELNALRKALELESES